MKIKQYIVTYKNAFQLNKCLGTIFNGLTQEELSKLELFVINNHSEFRIDESFKDKVTVLHNMTRPDFSTGHLSRDWNAAIINGFKDLNNPDCDIVITNQDDTEFKPNYINELIELHKTYDFIQLGVGDQVISYTPDAIKKIGLWDERCCNIGFQEMEYFIRVILYHPEKSTINDWRHNRIHNPFTGNENPIIYNTLPGGDRKEPYHMESLKYHNVAVSILSAKWKDHHTLIYGEHNKRKELIERLRESGPHIPSHIFYPYFEKSIPTETLAKQNYTGYRELINP